VRLGNGTAVCSDRNCLLGGIPAPHFYMLLHLVNYLRAHLLFICFFGAGEVSFFFPLIILFLNFPASGTITCPDFFFCSLCFPIGML